MLTLFLGSTNAGKLREFQNAAAAMDITVRPVPEISHLPSCQEDGLTFEANACKKALHFARLTAGLVFADDSGLAVDALGGAPGVYSSRFSGPGATEESNNQKLITELYQQAAGRTGSGRPSGSPGSPSISGFPAHYVCVIVLAEGERTLSVVEGRSDGLIIAGARGNGGFGYDPYFYYPPLGKTFAELTSEQKFRVSHRGIAFRKLLEFLFP